MNPKLRKRLVDSIEYLRKMDFFKDYSSLSSEEILGKIFDTGELRYPISWRDEKKGHLWGAGTVSELERNWRRWLKASDFEIDRMLIPFDTKKVMVEEAEAWIDDGMGEAILRRIARISGGIFQPTSISWRWLTPAGSKWSIQEVSFDFKGRRHRAELALRHDYIEDMGLREINELIEDTGYQYYSVNDEWIIIVILRKEEAEKLRMERGWEFEYVF
ncbi:MAG: hypothetical protein QXU11_08790 [Thermoproteota archaeon]